jgi:hypothetical protein
MWRCVGLVLTDVSEERIASIFREEKSAREEPVWAGGCRLRRYVPPKRRLTQDLHSATSQETTFFIVTAVKASNLSNRLFIVAEIKLVRWKRGANMHASLQLNS